MASANDMNIILSQGDVINKIHNVRKQSLEVNQQFTAQNEKLKQKRKKSKVQKFETENRIEIQDRYARSNNGKPIRQKKKHKKGDSETDTEATDNIRVDITV